MNEENKVELLRLLKINNYRELKDNLIKFNEVDIAEFLQDIDKLEALAIFRLLPEAIAIETFSYLESDVQEQFISAMTSYETVELVDKLYIDDMVDLLEEMPNSIVNKIMRNLKGEKRNLINEYLNYPKDSAGSIMTSAFFSVNENRTIQDILKKMRKLDLLDESFYTLYITDNNNVLKGYVEIREMLINQPDTKISDILNENVVYVETTDDKEEVAKLIDKYEFLTIPVVDKEKKLVGVVTFDDAIQVLNEETEEDFSKMAAITPNENKYLDTSIFELSKMRFLWLLLLMMSSTLSQFVINSFNDVITALTGLVAFMPMLTDSAGNAGSQSSTTIIRGLSIGEIELSDTPKILAKEFMIALLVGVGLAGINFVRIILFGGVSTMMALSVSLSLLITIIISKLIGALLPVGATLLKWDPTIMAAPLLTTIVDSMSLFVYFTIAKLLLL
ncbi:MULTISPECIES: magnesium transporter [Helcococcus]|uniref:Magnesium transporter MgtE n=1 Tax=Helcococcus bovis TaxID=3153252 RepID=A0ABW9F8K4_9FIRM